jgi:allantoin racemase
MRRLLVINPNTNALVTRWLEDEALRVAPEGTEIVATNAESGLAALQTPEDVEIAGRAVVQTIEAYAKTPDLMGAIVAAFGDPGLAAARAQAPMPVVGLGEAGILAAGRGGRRFSIVTLGAAMRGSILMKAAALGVGANLAECRVLPFSISQMIADRGGARSLIMEAVRSCRGEAVLLGGAPFAGMAREAHHETGKVVLDGVEACVAAIMAET